MWFRKTKPAPGLTEELVQRVWDISGNLKQVESVLEERLTELAARYRRAEQSEKRLDAKRASDECGDCDEDKRVHPALRARLARRESVNNRLKENV